MKNANHNREGLALYNALIERKTGRVKLIKRTVQSALLVAFLVPLLCFVYFGVWIHSSAPSFMLAALVLLVLSLVINTTQRLTVDEYKSLPGSTDSHGHHRCIACGNKGIYRRTIYRTTTTLAACSKCEQPLWAVEGES